MDLELTGRTGLVIGGSSGIGAATVEVLAEEGCDVVVTYRELCGRGAAVGRLGCGSLLVGPGFSRLDPRSPDKVSRAAQELASTARLPRCGRGSRRPQCDHAVWSDRRGGMARGRRREPTGVFFAVQAITPLVRPGGAIVTVASVAAHTGAPHHMHYAAAKAGPEPNQDTRP